MSGAEQGKEVQRERRSGCDDTDTTLNSLCNLANLVSARPSNTGSSRTPRQEVSRAHTPHQEAFGRTPRQEASGRAPRHEASGSSVPAPSKPCAPPHGPPHVAGLPVGHEVPGNVLAEEDPSAVQAAIEAVVQADSDTAAIWQQLLFLLLSVSSALQAGAARPATVRELGTVLAAALEMLVTEATWLVAQVEASHGTGSPHLKYASLLYYLTTRLGIACSQALLVQRVDQFRTSKRSLACRQLQPSGLMVVHASMQRLCLAWMQLLLMGARTEGRCVSRVPKTMRSDQVPIVFW